MSTFRVSLTLFLSTVIATVLCLSLYSQETKSPRSALQTPPQALSDFFEKIYQGDITSAIRMTDSIEAGESAMTAYYNRIVQFSKENRFSVIAHVQVNDLAVVVFRTSDDSRTTIDLDPAYMVRRDNHWRVLFKLTDSRVEICA